MKTSWLPWVVGAAAVAGAWYFLRKKTARPAVRRTTQAQVELGALPQQGALAPSGWNDGMYLGPEQTAEEGRGAPALWQTSQYVPAPGRGIASDGVQKVWLPSNVFGQQTPQLVQDGDTPATVAAKIYQDTSKPSSNAAGVPAWATAVRPPARGAGPRTAAPQGPQRFLTAARELGRVAEELQNDVMYRATGFHRGQSSSRTVSAVFDKDVK